jgi:hypothetical protein
LGKKLFDSGNGVRSGLLHFSWVLHLVWLVLFICILVFGPFQKTRDDCSDFLGSMEVFEICELGDLAGSALATASQMGRLDIVSIALTVLGTVLAASALASFVLIRGAAKDAAADEAIEWLNKKKSELITTELVETAILSDRIILTLANEIKRRISDDEGTIDGETANSIATAMDEKNEL